MENRKLEQDVSNAKKTLEDLIHEIDKKETESDELQKEIAEMHNQVVSLSNDIDLLHQEIKLKDAEIDKLLTQSK